MSCPPRRWWERWCRCGMAVVAEAVKGGDGAELWCGIGRSDARPAHAPAGAFALLSEARAAGLTAQMELAGRSLKGQLGFADSLGARYVAILGDGGETALKDMSDGGQQTLAADAVVHAVLRGLRTL